MRPHAEHTTVETARRLYTAGTDDIEIDDDAEVVFVQGGAWVAAQVWVDHEEMP